MAIIQSTLLLALAGAAAAGTTKYPEIKPGAGLPSLAELGLTSADLYKMGKPNFRKPLLLLRTKTRLTDKHGRAQRHQHSLQR